MGAYRRIEPSDALVKTRLAYGVSCAAGHGLPLELWLPGGSVRCVHGMMPHEYGAGARVVARAGAVRVYRSTRVCQVRAKRATGG